MILHVESRAGLHGEPEPVSFMLGESRIEVVRIDDRWFGENYVYFKLAASDGGSYILRYTATERLWELTVYQTTQSDQSTHAGASRRVT